MTFIQAAPELRNQYDDDPALRGTLARLLPDALARSIAPDLTELGEHAAKAWHGARQCTPRVPQLNQWSTWGERVDNVELTPAWEQGPHMTTRYGLLAHGHDPALGRHARTVQFAHVYLYHVASEFFTCPLAMSDGAISVLQASADAALREDCLARLLSRDVAQLWIAGQWMTETIGGSDVARSQTRAHQDAHGQWRLRGRKWFTSAVTGDMALALARVGDDGPLALFHVPTRNADGSWNGIRIDRLKDKLGTRELPTAEIHLLDSRATMLGEPGEGVRRIVPMLNITRTWNAVCAVATMRRCLALATDYARRRQAFGRRLIDLPAHARTLAMMHARFEAAFHLTFLVSTLLGRAQQDGSRQDAALLRLLTPLAKLWTGKLAVAIASECCEALGGTGYIENSGMPLLLRDAQVYPIWEGTTDVLSLELLRALSTHGLGPLAELVDDLLPQLPEAATVRATLDEARVWLDRHGADEARLQAGARGLAITLAQCAAAAALAEHAGWARQHQGDPRPAIALRLFCAQGLDALSNPLPDDFQALLDQRTQ